MQQAGPPQPDVEKLKEHSPEGDPLIEAIRRRGSGGTPGVGYDYENEQAAKIAAQKPSPAEAALSAVDSATNSTALRILARAALKAGNFRGKLINPTDANVTDLATGRVNPKVGAITRAASYQLRVLQGLEGSTEERERISPYFVNAVYDPKRELPVSSFAGAALFHPVDIKSRAPLAGEAEASGAIAGNLTAIRNAAGLSETTSVPTAIPRSSYIWNGILGRNEDDRGTFSAWMPSSLIKQGNASLIPGPTSLALIKASKRDSLSLVCSKICYEQNYPVTFYVRRAAPVRIRVGTAEQLVYPMIALRASPESLSTGLEISQQSISSFGRAQQIPVWDGHSESFSVQFVLHCRNRAEMINNRDQIAWLVDMLKPSYSSSGEIESPGGWCYIRAGSWSLHEGSEELLVFVTGLESAPLDGSGWESVRSAGGDRSFEHPFAVSISIRGVRVVENEVGMKLTVSGK